MNRPLLLCFGFAAVLLGTLGAIWLQVPPSNQELLANVAKALDYAEGWKSVGAPPWWTPCFLAGTSLAPTLSYLASSLWILAWTALAGIYSGAKIGGFVALFLAVIGVYFWVDRLLKNSWAAAAAALALLLTPSLYVRLGGVEHIVFVSAFAVIPWVLLLLTNFVERPHRLNGILFGSAFALLLLAYAKAAAIMLPLLCLYAAAYWFWKQRTWKLPFNSLLFALAAFILLGVLPNLPGLREMRFATVFELSPLEGWKSAFSLKSSILWFDRDGILSQGMADSFAPTTAQGGNYLGLLPAALLIALLVLRPRSLYDTACGFCFRLSLALALVAHWLSFGPYGLLFGQIEFLHLAINGPDLAIPLAWLILVLQPWIIFRLLPPEMPGRNWIGASLSAVYLIIPGFRLIGWLPIYSDFRAPHDFSQTGGIFFLALALGAAAWLMSQILAKSVPKLFWPAVVLLTLLDISPYLRPFFQSPLDRATFDDFRRAENFLATAPRQGSVHPLSGRYFYLLTPHLAKRGLTSEAFNSYLMQRGMNFLQVGAQISPALITPFLNLSGTAYVFVDKKDPDTPENLQEQFRKLLPTAYENDHFLILENKGSLAPAQLARNFVGGDANLAQTSYAGLVLEKLGVIALPAAAITPSTSAGLVGHIGDDGYRLNENVSPEKTAPFSPLALTSPRLSNYQRISVAAPTSSGWALIPEASHPDWKAYRGTEALNVRPADGALLSAFVGQPGEPITFSFEPPWWYDACLLASALGWLVLLAGLAVLPVIPPPFRQWLRTLPELKRSQPVLLDTPREPIRRALVIIPTYNEANNLPTLIERVLAAEPRLEMLVVDDNSPDGTSKIVRDHPQFGLRLHLLARSGKLGLGSAYKDGFQWAFAHDFDACLEMDADFSHDPADLPRLLAALDQGADAAVGSRYLHGVRVMNWPEHRLLLSTGASRFVRGITGLPMTDATSGFKALRSSVLKTLDWSKFRAEGYGFQIELHYFLWRRGAKLVEVPIVFTERRDGETKMSIGIAIEAAWRTAQLNFSRSRKP